MQFLLEFVKGISQCFGFVFGIFILLFLMKLMKPKDDNDNEIPLLLKAFEDYLILIKQQEKYEELTVVENIIKDLKNNIKSNDIKLFKIKKDSSLSLNDKDDNTSLFKIIKEYINFII